MTALSHTNILVRLLRMMKCNQKSPLNDLEKHQEDNEILFISLLDMVLELIWVFGFGLRL